MLQFKINFMNNLDLINANKKQN